MEPNGSSEINNAYSRDNWCLHYLLQDLQRRLKIELHTEAQENSLSFIVLMSSS